jgi:hypothetical protein
MKMNKMNTPEHDLDNFLKQTLKDDLSPEAEARMSRQFLNLKRTLDQPEGLAERGHWLMSRVLFRKEILAFVSAVMLILGAVMHLTGDQSVLAYSLERLKMVGAVSMSLHRATSMDCTALISGVGGEYSRYRVRWCATGLTRVDVDSAGGTQTLRMSNKAVSIADYLGGAAHAPAITEMPSDRIWQPALEFLTPTILAQHVEEQYALMQAEGRDGAGSEEFLLVGQENQQVVEIAVDARTYLPKTLKKYLPDSGRTREKRECLMEVRFQWNQPIPQELFVPESQVGRSHVNH